MNNPTLFSDFLQELGVPHTLPYSNCAFRDMPFQSCFGLCKLLKQYGVDTEALQLADKDDIDRLTPPFLARTPRGFVIVTGVTSTAVTYLSQGVHEMAPRRTFLDAWTGMVLLAFPGPGAAEPGYSKHHFQVEASVVKRWLLLAAVAFVAVYLFISHGLGAHVSTWLLTLFNGVGLFFTTLLVRKSANVKSRVADRMCGVLQKGGCDSVLATKASSFFGLFGWSEVGFAYFSVSLAVMFLFPRWLCYLALCNACCLPFTLWSIWYQKFRAKAWCTLCVCTQATLWCLFFCYLGGGWFRNIFPLRIEFFVIGATYLAALLALNRLMPLVEKIKPDAYNETDFKA